MITVLETKIMRGPSLWSVSCKQLVVLKLECQVPDQQQSANLCRLMLHEFPGFTAEFNNDGSLKLPEALCYLALELQRLAGMSCRASVARRAKGQAACWVAYEYQVEKAGVSAGRAAIEIITAFLNNKPVNTGPILHALEKLKHQYLRGATTQYLLGEVRKRNIPYRQFNTSSLFILGHGSSQKKLRTAVTGTTSGIGIEIAGDKEETKQVLAQANIPVPKGTIIYEEEELRKLMAEFRRPMVIKPLSGNQGRGVSTNIQTLDKALFGFEAAKKISDEVIVEEHVTGNDYRFLVINYKLVAVARRIPAQVIGNGRLTIKELIEQENTNPERGDSLEHVLSKIKTDPATFKLLFEKGLTLHSVLKTGEVLVLKDTANISAGGTAEDVTSQVHPETKFMAERIARIFNLDICGIDIIATTISEPLTPETGAVIEVNAGPGLRMHSNPQKGTAINVAAPILDMLFPQPDSFRIPIVAVTGTNGKTTTTRLVAQLAKQAGYRPGYCTTDGIYINGHRIFKGDCTGFLSAQDVLFDPVTDFAVLECARGGILRSGLGFDACDVSIVTNITEDHLGLNDIYTIEEMRDVKLVVPLSTKKTGYAVLNADDSLVYGMREKLSCRIALFSMHAPSEPIRRHCAEGGLAAFMDGEQLMVCHRGSLQQFCNINDLPLALNGRSEAMVKNIMATVLAGLALELSSQTIISALRQFEPGPLNTPGRMNIFRFHRFTVMVDYAHNVGGFEELKVFMDKTEAPRKIGIIAVAGDRRDEDIVKIGGLAAQMFHEIIIRLDEDRRGRKPGETAELLLKGIRRVNAALPVSTMPDEVQAIRYAIEHAAPNAFITVCAEQVENIIDYVQELLKKDQLVA